MCKGLRRTTTGVSDADESGSEEGMDEAAESEREEAMHEAGASEAGAGAEEEGGGEGAEYTWAAALRGTQVLGWVRGVCTYGEWTAGEDEAEVTDVRAEVRRRHGEVTMAEVWKALREAEEADAVLVRGTTVHFI